jgi:hypothetical protein
MAVDPGLADPTKEAQSIILNLWKTIKASNPKADPLTIMSAVQSQIEEVKGVAPITKATMQGQIAYLRAQTDTQYKMRRLEQYDHDWLIKMQNAKTAEERVRLTGEYQRGRLEIEQQRADTYEQGTELAHEDRQASTTARITVANINGKYRLQGIGEQQEGAGSRAQAALDGKHGASVAAGLSKFLAVNPQADPSTLDAVTDALESAYTKHSSSAQAPAPRAGPGKAQGGGIPSNVQQFAKQHNLTVIRKRADGKYDAKARDGTVGVIG